MKPFFAERGVTHTWAEEHLILSIDVGICLTQPGQKRSPLYNRFRHDESALIRRCSLANSMGRIVRLIKTIPI